ncbi:Uncharacterized protein SCF082_LOCUS15740 [Durusdinium trenchii]|uniref:Uncharacterized protein n=1 Tax=Durusdinium trenchii TaxID=1381693 RepID=A0ABP0K886_9DINO
MPACGVDQTGCKFSRCFWTVPGVQRDERSQVLRDLRFFTITLTFTRAGDILGWGWGGPFVSYLVRFQTRFAPDLTPVKKSCWRLALGFTPKKCLRSGSRWPAWRKWMLGGVLSAAFGKLPMSSSRCEGIISRKPRREDERWSFGATFLSLEKEDEWSWFLRGECYTAHAPRLCVVHPVPAGREENTSKESVQRSAYHTQELIGRTHELEENATKFVEDSVALLQRVKEKLQAAMDGTTSSMQMSINRLVQQKKELEKGLADSQEDIIRTERLLQHLQHEIHSQKASLDEWEAAPEISLDRLDQRLPLAVQQDIRQSAFERMQEQVHNAKSNVYVLSNKCEGSKDLLSQLREANAELREHLAAKTAGGGNGMAVCEAESRCQGYPESTSVKSERFLVCGSYACAIVQPYAEYDPNEDQNSSLRRTSRTWLRRDVQSLRPGWFGLLNGTGGAPCSEEELKDSGGHPQ